MILSKISFLSFRRRSICTTVSSSLIFPSLFLIIRDPSFSHYLGGPSARKFLRRSQFFPLSWGSFPPKKILKRSQLFSLSWGSFSKKKILQRSQFFPLSWGSFSKKKILQRFQFFLLSWGSPPKKKRHQGWGWFCFTSFGTCLRFCVGILFRTFLDILFLPSPLLSILSKILRGHTVPHFLGYFLLLVYFL